MRNLLQELKKLALENGDGIYGDLDLALKDINAILNAKNLPDRNQNIKLLLSPTSNLQDLARDCSWGEEFLLLVDKIEKKLK